MKQGFSQLPSIHLVSALLIRALAEGRRVSIYFRGTLGVVLYLDTEY